MLIVDEDHLELGAILFVPYSPHLHGLVPTTRDKYKDIYGHGVQSIHDDVHGFINYLVPCLPLRECVTP